MRTKQRTSAAASFLPDLVQAAARFTAAPAHSLHASGTARSAKVRQRPAHTPQQLMLQLPAAAPAAVTHEVRWGQAA